MSSKCIHAKTDKRQSKLMEKHTGTKEWIEEGRVMLTGNGCKTHGIKASFFPPLKAYMYKGVDRGRKEE